jgi:hypothetical protein
MLRFFSLVSLILITSNSASGNATSSSDDVAIQRVQNLMEWMQSKGGYIHSKVEIRRWNSSDPTSYFWVFTNAPIQNDELLIKITYAPYINYLKSQPKGQIPAMWSPAGQHLLLLVQGDLNTNGIETYADGDDLTMWLEEWFEKDCMLQEDGNGSLHPYFLALATTQRGYDRAMLPIRFPP